MERAATQGCQKVPFRWRIDGPYSGGGCRPRPRRSPGPPPRSAALKTSICQKRRGSSSPPPGRPPGRAERATIIGRHLNSQAPLTIGNCSIDHFLQPAPTQLNFMARGPKPQPGGGPCKHRNGQTVTHAPSEAATCGTYGGVGSGSTNVATSVAELPSRSDPRGLGIDRTDDAPNELQS